ncbi:MAG TPA: 2-oxoglutarate and iron-dependent oxygenase domain-containing protein [Propionibacteriaceae bacterium]
MECRDLPLLGLADLDRGEDARKAFGAALRTATHEVGFFHLRHGIPRDVISKLFTVARRFFDLSEAEKAEIAMIKSPWFRGYTRVGGELTQGVVDWREQIDVQTEREPSRVRDPAYLRLEGPNQWPASLPALRPELESWIERLTAIGRRLVSEWAVALGAEADHFESSFQRPSILLKLVRYPGTDSSEQGVGSHKDPGILTLLLVEPGVAGLQVERGGTWVDVPPVDDAFVVNIGELMEVATDGYLMATKHRVTAPPPGAERLSIPFFFNPSLDAEVPAIELPPELAAEARGVTQDAQNVIGSRYGENLLKARLRAHPDVAAAHHPDLVDTDPPHP